MLQGRQAAKRPVERFPPPGISNGWLDSASGGREKRRPSSSAGGGGGKILLREGGSVSYRNALGGFPAALDESPPTSSHRGN